MKTINTIQYWRLVNIICVLIVIMIKYLIRSAFKLLFPNCCKSLIGYCLKLHRSCTGIFDYYLSMVYTSTLGNFNVYNISTTLPKNHYGSLRPYQAELCMNISKAQLTKISIMQSWRKPTIPPPRYSWTVIRFIPP